MTGESTTDALTTTEVGTSGEGTTEAGTSGEGTTEAGTTEAGTTEAGTTEAGTDTDVGLSPGTYDVSPTIATCIFLPGMGQPLGVPSICTANATTQNETALQGLMYIDTEVMALDGAGRRAESFIRFDIPPEYAGLTVVAATLHVQVADGDSADGPQRGELYRSAPFDEDSLKLEGPATPQKLADDQGVANKDAWIDWSIPVGLVVAGSPVYLGLLPVNNDGVLYRGEETEPGSPYLTVVLE